MGAPAWSLDCGELNCKGSRRRERATPHPRRVRGPPHGGLGHRETGIGRVLAGWTARLPSPHMGAGSATVARCRHATLGACARPQAGHYCRPASPGAAITGPTGPAFNIAMLTLGPQPRHLPILAVLLLTGAALALGGFYRMPNLEQRILHTDEAVHAVKFSQLLEDGSFVYDPKDYHGPTMYFATLAWAKFAEWRDSSDVTVVGLRSVIVVFGLLALISPLLFMNAIGRGPAVLACLLLAASPAFVYYSRYYIMEMPLVVFAAAALFCGWRWHQTHGRLWLIFGGVLLGLMHATKETFVFNIAAAVGAGWCLWMVRPRAGGLRLGDYRRKKHPNPWPDLAALVVPFLLTSALLMSNFFQHPQAIIDSYRTYLLYFERAGGSGHEKPWYFYLQTLAWNRAGFVWTELFVLVLAVIGAGSLWTRRESVERPVLFGRFIALYTLFQFIGYSIIPYKTPWTILSAYYGCVLLAGIGVAALMHVSTHRLWRLAVMGMLVAGLWHLCLQSKRVTGRFEADPRNPYVYSHTNPMLMRLVRQLHDLQAVLPEGESLRVQVIQFESGWPLPWYLRDMPFVGFQNAYRPDLDADVFVVDAQFAAPMRENLGDDFVQDGPHSLRPGVMLQAFVRRPLWERLLEARGVRPAVPTPGAGLEPADPDEPLIGPANPDPLSGLLRPWQQPAPDTPAPPLLPPASGQQPRPPGLMPLTEPTESRPSTPDSASETREDPPPVPPDQLPTLRALPAN